jgi:NAD(P)-dependent dehydrogenase (short-subunit alcohol dehydrogenase family)
MTAFDLTGKVAVITGGNGGIGLGMAEGLVEAGCAVHIWGRNPEKNQQALQQLRAKKGGRAEALAVDISDQAAIEAAFGKTLDLFGRVDGCFANAGVGGGGRRSFLDRTQDDWHELMATNLDGAVMTLQVAGRHMVERAGKGDPGGRLVATSSMASLYGTQKNEHYAASKAALNAITKAVAVELARYRVTAHAILPGWIKTDMTERVFNDDKFVGAVIPRIPLRRFGDGKDFAGIAVYIMSDASAYHTGGLFVIDGGYGLF